MKAFCTTLEINGLLDTSWKNQRFIWSIRNQDNTFTRERLDRVVANKNWLEIFGWVGVEVFTLGRSDHQ